MPKSVNPKIGLQSGAVVLYQARILEKVLSGAVMTL